MSHGGRPLSLSDAQLAALMQVAASLPIQWRGRALAALADQLLLVEEASDVQVQQAIAHVLERLGGGRAA